jgi:hypothetical protein
MDNLGVRLPVDATAKSKFKSERPHESYERKNDCWFQKAARDARLCESIERHVLREKRFYRYALAFNKSHFRLR